MRRRAAAPTLGAMALLQLRGIVKSFGSRTILDGLDFDVEPGARVGVIGPNGGGKSTLMRILAGLEIARAARPDLDELDHELARVATQLGSLGDDLERLARVLRRQEQLVE